ncbi:hypothetical protein glysoja_000400 [Glycine soja]|nr:hypothetical protein glysoja_000400 [Glycine soja]
MMTANIAHHHITVIAPTIHSYVGDDHSNFGDYNGAKVIHRFKCTSKTAAKILEETCFAWKQTQNSAIVFRCVQGCSEILVKLNKSFASSKGLILCRATSNNTPVELFVNVPSAVMITWCFTLKTQQIGPQITPASLTSLKKVRGKQWKQGGRNMKFNMPICCNGVIHFIFLIALLFRPYIMSYNVESGDTSTMLRVPKDTRRGTHDSSCDMSIFIWGKASEAERFICLVRLRKSVFAVWILTDYESSRWLRNLKVRTKGVVGLREKDPKLTGFTVMNGDLLVFATETRILFGSVAVVMQVCFVKVVSK